MILFHFENTSYVCPLNRQNIICRNKYYIWRYSRPWHKVLNAVVAELSIYKLENQRGRIDSLWL